MTDLESQARDCLSHHAEQAAVDPALTTGVADRSRQLGRRRPALAVAAVIPIVAAIVVGAVMLGSSSPAAAPQRVTVRPAASVRATQAPTPAPSPTALPHASLQVCPTGRIPNVRVAAARLPISDKTLHTAHGRPVRAYALVQHYAIDGTPVARDSQEYLVAMAVGPHGRAWQVLKQDGGQKTFSGATFLGCVRAP